MPDKRLHGRTKSEVARRHRAIRLRPWSSHGEAHRNSGHFTRGSQLIGHEYAMWWRGARILPIVWAGIVLLLLWLRLHTVLGPYETRMIGMRMLAGFWSHIGMAEGKSVHVVLSDGTTLRTVMPLVPLIPDVIVAWEMLISALVGALLLASAIMLPISVWFIRWARDRGETILADHHERGVELTTRAHLLGLLTRHNARALRERARAAWPGLRYEEACAREVVERRAAGLVAPYGFATLPFPLGHEQSHVMVIGTTGSGKTTALRDLVRQAVARGDNAVIFDLTGHYVEAFYRPECDHILNLSDARCETWSIFNDCDTQSEFVAAANALIPPERGNDGGFWEKAARMLLVEMCVKLKAQGLGSNRALADELMKATLARIHARMKGTVADPLTSPDAARMAQSIRAVLNAHGEALRFLPENGAPFSIRDWLKRDDGSGSLLFITAQYVHLDMSRSLLTLWMNVAINTLMTLPHTRTLRTWYVFDELGALHQLPALTRGLQTARSFGGAFVLGLHSFAALRDVYGENGARNIISLAGTKLILRTSDRDTAEECSKLIGYRKVRTMDEAYSYGAHQTRDASTISPTTREEALVIADDITSLMNLGGYIRFPERFPSAHVTLAWRDYPKIASGFIAASPPPLDLVGDDDAEDGGRDGAGEAGGRDGASDKLAEREPGADHGGQDRTAPSIWREPTGGAYGEDQDLWSWRQDLRRDALPSASGAQAVAGPPRNIRRSTLGGGQVRAEWPAGLEDRKDPAPSASQDGTRHLSANQPGRREAPSTSLRDARRDLTLDFGEGENAARRGGAQAEIPPAIDDDREPGS